MSSEANDRYPNALQPIKLGPVEVRNRIYMSPHGIPLEATLPGQEGYRTPSAEIAHYFAERAKGGVGLIFHSTLLGPFATQPGLATTPGLTEAIPHYRRIAEMVHAEGGKVMAEIWYVAWKQHLWEATGPESPQLAPSAIGNYDQSSTRHALAKEDIPYIVEAHAVATRNLREAGYDGVEAHVSHGAILEYFLSPYYNRRTDEYGGSLENRARLLCEVLEVMQREAGDEMAVGIRLTVDQMLRGGFDQDGVREILEHLKPTGLLDFVDLDISVEPDQRRLMSTTFFEPKLHNADRVANVSDAAAPIPVLATPGRVTTLAEAEELIEDEVVDMVGIVRGLIAEPEIVNNAIAGKEGTSRTCIAANHCAGGGFAGFGCAINPAAGKEERWGQGKLAKAASPKKVVIVGAGPAGLEAARAAGLRGHDVTVLERKDSIGGGLDLWARLPGREHVANPLMWWTRRLDELGITVQTGVDASAASVLALAPDTVVVATGSRYAADGESGYLPYPIAGWDQGFVHTPEDVLEGGVHLSGTVVVLDDEGLHTASGIAEIAALSGASVELVTRKPLAASGLLGNSQFSYVVGRMKKAGVTVSTATYVREIGDGAITLYDTWTSQDRVVTDVGAVVLATMRKPVHTLADELRGQVPHVYLVGDALAPRSLREATYEGHRFGRVIGEPDAPATVTEELFKPFAPIRPAALA